MVYHVYIYFLATLQLRVYVVQSVFVFFVSIRCHVTPTPVVGHSSGISCVHMALWSGAELQVFPVREVEATHVGAMTLLFSYIVNVVREVEATLLMWWAVLIALPRHVYPSNS